MYVLGVRLLRGWRGLLLCQLFGQGPARRITCALLMVSSCCRGLGIGRRGLVHGFDLRFYGLTVFLVASFATAFVAVPEYEQQDCEFLSVQQSTF